jgi:4-amino-4-deoxy-L-arabinose transferase-like glycosyltransferase
MLSAGIVFVAALILYVRTLLPDVGFWDTAEFQTIGPVLGIAHPTGYPTYTLLAWVASVVLGPFGNEAYRADLLSALLTAGAAALIATATMALTRRPALGVVAGLLFAITPAAWRVAVRADAHALHVFLAALLLVLLIAWMQREQAASDASGRSVGRSRPGALLVVTAIVYGLALGNHALTVLLAPGIAVFVLLVEPRIIWRRPRLVLACVAAVVVTTLAVYAYIPLRSAMDPPLDYAEPHTWEGFWYLVLGRQFPSGLGPLPALPDITAGAWEQLWRNLGLVALLAPVGAVAGLLRHARVVMLTSLWFVCTWVFALDYPNAAIERYYLVPLLAACLWVAFALDAGWDALKDFLWPQAAGAPDGTVGSDRSPARSAVGAAALAGLLILVLLPLPERYGQADASGDTRAREWLDATLEALEEDAVVISWWSYSTPLWYGRWVEGRRDDVLIIDDRDIIDDGFGDVAGAIDRYLGERPVYVIRRSHELERLGPPRYSLRAVGSDVPFTLGLYRVRRTEPQGQRQRL